MRSLLVLLAVPVGLVVGGFVTMVADRAPGDLPLLRPGPRCPYCERPLALADTVPVVSWFRLGGRCRRCSHRITPAYPVVEGATALLFLAAALEFGDSWVVLPFLVLYATLVAVSVVDLYHYRIPDRITVPAFLVSLALMAAVSVGYDEPSAIGRALLGAGVFFVALLLPHLVSPAGMGFGDVKLGLLLGLFLGWLGGDTITIVRLVLVTLILASLLGVAAGLVLKALRGRGYDPLPDPEAAEPEPAEAEEPARAAVGVVIRPASAAFPFGPALAVATIVSTLFAEQLLGL